MEIMADKIIVKEWPLIEKMGTLVWNYTIMR